MTTFNLAICAAVLLASPSSCRTQHLSQADDLDPGQQAAAAAQADGVR